MSTTATKPKSRLKAKPPLERAPTKPKVLIFGDPGVGKTWWSLDFPKAYLIDAEEGSARTQYMAKLAASGGEYMGREEGAQDFETVIGQIQALATEKHEFKTVVIDSISKLFHIAVANEAERLGDKDAFGASKKPAVAYMRRLVNWIQRLDMNVILIAHSKDDWGLDAQGNRCQIGKTFDAWDRLAFELDLVLELTKQGASRVAVVKKSRLLGFEDRSRFPLSYDTFAEKYGKEVIEKATEVITLASPEQVTEIRRLVSLLRLEPEETNKLLTKAQASDWDEMSEDQAAKTILFYQAKVSGESK